MKNALADLVLVLNKAWAYKELTLQLEICKMLYQEVLHVQNVWVKALPVKGEERHS